MMIVFWTLVFIAALLALVKGSDWLIGGAERIGLAAGMSSFIIGVTIVAIGTSFPELVASISALIKGVPEVVVANAVGSNITNIFLVIGLSALLGRQLSVEKNLIDLDLPLLAAGTVIFLVVAWDGTINPFESIVLVLNFAVYLVYTVNQRDRSVVPISQEEIPKVEQKHPERFIKKDIGLIVIGAIALALGANFLIDSIVVYSHLLGFSTGLITITAVALGTSLPELAVSARAVLQGKTEVAVGNIFGSNVFNILMVVGVPGVFASLPLDEQTLAVGIPFLALATFLFVISGISRRIHAWEGSFYISLYILFLAKIFALF
ncbi:MAG: calcium/sodium antiporter [Candidatus Paceibacterota bacterium]